MDSFARLLTQGLNETLFYDEEVEEPHRKRALAAHAATQHQHATDHYSPTSSKSSSGRQVRARRQDAGQQPHTPPSLIRKDVSRGPPAQQLDRAHSHIKHKMQTLQSQPTVVVSDTGEEEVVSKEAEEGQGGGLLDV
eukprot:978622-Pelagomonas_calceolata.AAC.1